MDTPIARVAKRVLPRSGKKFAKRVLRAYGVGTSSLRVLPDFLVIGTKRGGTTSLWNALLQHPMVLPLFPAAQDIKSPHYFYWHYAKGLNWYRSHFPTRAYQLWGCRDGCLPVVGEASPYYLYHPGTPVRAQLALPKTKIIVLLRNPVDRAYSHYWERVDQGVEPLSFPDALKAEEDRLAGEVARMAQDPCYYSRFHDWYSYRERGVYLPQLQRWERCFPSEQFLVLRSEDLFADQPRIVSEVLRFLGIPAHTLPATEHRNRRPAERMDSRTRAELVAFYEPHNQRLYAHLGRELDWEVGSRDESP